MTRVMYQLAVDWDDDGSFATAGDDISALWLWGRGLTASRGRDRASQLTGRSVAGRLSCVLSNSDNRFSSFNAGSSLAGKVLPGRKVRLSAYALPCQIAGLHAWYKADAITGLSTGDPLTSWPDSSGNGYNAAVITAPTYRAADGPNGKPCVRFASASSQALSADAAAAALSGSDKAFTLFAVAKNTDTAGTYTLWNIGRSTTGTPYHQLTTNTTPNYQVLRRDDAATLKQLVTGTPSTSAFQITSAVFTGTLGSLFVDGPQSGSDTDLDVGSVTVDRMGIGCLRRNTNAQFFNGDIAELILFSRALSANERKLIEAYLSLKYNLGNLGYALWGGFLDTIEPQPAVKGPKVAGLTASGPLAWLNDPKRTVSVAMQTSILTGTAIGHLLDAANWPAGDRTLDTGQTTMTRWWQSGASPLAGLRKVEDSEAGFLSEGADRKVRYEDRHHRLKSPHTVSQATYSDQAGATLNYYHIEQVDPWDDVYNRFEAKVQIYSVGALAVLWTLAQTGANSPSIPPGGSQDFWARYPNPDSGTDAVGVDAWTTPVASTDYTANSAANGSGTDLTASVSVSVTKLGNDMRITLTNTASVTAYITLLQARGTPVSAADPIPIRSEDATSQSRYGVRTFPNPAEFVPNVAEAQGWANWHKGIYAEPLPWLRVTLWGNVSVDHMGECLTRDISDRVTVRADGDAGLGINEDFFVEAIEHRVTAGQHFTTFTLSPAEQFSDGFVLGTSRLGSTTRLVY